MGKQSVAGVPFLCELDGLDAVAGVGVGTGAVGVVLRDGGAADHDFRAAAGRVELLDDLVDLVPDGDAEGAHILDLLHQVGAYRDIQVIEDLADQGGRPDGDTAAKVGTYQDIVRRLSQNPGLRPQDILISLVGVAKEDWSFGNGVAQLLEPTA